MKAHSLTSTSVRAGAPSLLGALAHLNTSALKGWECCVSEPAQRGSVRLRHGGGRAGGGSVAEGLPARRCAFGGGA